MSASPESKDELMPLRRSTRKSVATKVEDQVLTPKKRKSTATPIKNAPDKNVEAVGTPRRARGTPRKSMGEELTVTPRKSISRAANKETPRKSVANETSPSVVPKETNRRTPRKSTVVETSPSADPKETKRTTRKSTVAEMSPTTESKDSTKRTPRKSIRTAKETKIEESEMAKVEEVSANTKGRRKSVAVSSTKNINTSSDEDSKNTESTNEDLPKQSPKRKARKSVHFKKEVDEHQLEPESEFSSSPSPAKSKTNKLNILDPEKYLKSSLALVPRVILTDINSGIKEGKLAEAVTANMKVGDHPTASETDESVRPSIDDALLSPSKFLQSDDDDVEDRENKTISSKVQECDRSNDNSKLSPKVPSENEDTNNVEEHFKSPRRKLSYEIQVTDDCVDSKACKNLNSFEDPQLKLNASTNDNVAKSVSSTQNSVISESRETCQVTTSSLNDTTLPNEDASSPLNAPQTFFPKNSLESEVSSTETNALPMDNSEECKGVEESKNNLSFTVSSTDDVTSESLIKTNVDLDSSVVPDTLDEELVVQETTIPVKNQEKLSESISIKSNVEKLDESIQEKDHEEKHNKSIPVKTPEDKLNESIQDKDPEEKHNKSIPVKDPEDKLNESSTSIKDHDQDKDCEEKHNESDPVKDIEDALTESISVKGNDVKISENIPDKDCEEKHNESDPVKDIEDALVESISVKGNDIKISENIPDKDCEEKHNESDPVKDIEDAHIESISVKGNDVKISENIPDKDCEEKLNESNPVKVNEEILNVTITVENNDSSKVEEDISLTDEATSPKTISSVQNTNDSLKLEDKIDEIPKSGSVTDSPKKLVECENDGKNNEGHSLESNLLETPIDKIKSEEKIKGNECESNVSSESEVVSSPADDIIKNNDDSITSATVQKHLDSSIALNEGDDKEITLLKVTESLNPADLAVLNVPEKPKPDIVNVENKLSNSTENQEVVESSAKECDKTENEVNSCKVIENKDDFEPSQVGENDNIVIEDSSKETPNIEDSHSQNLSVSEINEDKSVCSVPVSLQSPDTRINEGNKDVSETQSPAHSIVDSSTMKNEEIIHRNLSISVSVSSTPNSSPLKNCNKGNIDFEKDKKNDLHNTSLQSSNVSSPSIIDSNEKEISEIASTSDDKSALTENNSEESEYLKKCIDETYSGEKEIEYSSPELPSEGCSLDSSKLKCIPTSSSSAAQCSMDSSESDSEIIESVTTTDHCVSLPSKPQGEDSNVEQEKTSTLSDSKDNEISKSSPSMKSKSEAGVISNVSVEGSRDSLSEQSLTMEKTTLLGKRRKQDDLIIEPKSPVPGNQENEIKKKSSSNDSDEESGEENIKKQSPLGKRSLKSSVHVVAKKIKTTPENRSKTEKCTKIKKQGIVEKTLVESFLDLEAEEGEESEMSENSSESFSDSSEPHSPFSSALDFIQSMAKEKTCHIGTIESLFGRKSLSEDEDDTDWVPPKKKANLKSKEGSQRHVKDPTSGKKDLRHKLEKIRRKNKPSSKECSSDTLDTKQGTFSVSLDSEMLVTAKSAENIPAGFSVDDCDIYSSPKQYIPKGFVVSNSKMPEHSEVQNKSKNIKKSNLETSAKSSESSAKSSRKQKIEPSNVNKSSIEKSIPKHLGVAVLPFRLKKSEIKKAFGDAGINDIVSVEYSSLTTALLQFSEKKSLKKALNLYGQILYNGMPIYVLENKSLS